MSDVIDRIIASGRRSPLQDMPAEDVAIVRRAFLEHPHWVDLYLFYDKHVEEGDVFRARQTSRTAQLVSISTDGIPRYITRVGFKRWHSI